MPADGTGATSYESRDFDTSPFFGQPWGEPPPATTYISVVPRAKHNGAARIYCICYIDDDGLKIKTLCHSKMKEGAVRRCYFDLRSIRQLRAWPALPSNQLSRASADLQSVGAGKGNTLAIA